MSAATLGRRLSRISHPIAYGTDVEDLVVPRGSKRLVGELAAWVVPHRVWEGRHHWHQLRSGGCTWRRSLRIAASGRRTNALVNTRLELLPGHVLDELRVAVDVGANIGEWTAGLLKLSSPRRVLVFEPSPRVFPIVRGRFADRSEVTVIQAAVGDVDGTTPFQLTEHSHNASVLEPRSDRQELLDGGGHVRERAQVDICRLDTALAGIEAVDLLKIDVQGFERSVLVGASSTLGKTSWALLEANFVSLYDGDLLLPELHGLMSNAGFSLANLSRPYIRKGQALFSDALYRRD